MTKYNIIAIGKLPKEYEPLFNHLITLLGKDIIISEITPKKTLPYPEIISYESSLILEKIQKTSLVILLDIKGKTFSSENFANTLNKLTNDGHSNISFIIGGAWGVSEEVKARANLSISLSPMTFPHMLARIILMEQIYRTIAISNNHPYHK
jgi:23S rRNA (pseudouridine1915-N3)-methyltransferase